MIYGIGTDIVAIDRVATLYARFGERLAERLLAPEEVPALAGLVEPARLLAKRFAAKEAFAKALGTGLRAPAGLRSIAIDHDALGKPHFVLAPALAAHLAERGLSAHLSLSDERDFAVAFVILEQR